MATQKVYTTLDFQGISQISGVTALQITQNADQSDQAVRLQQLTGDTSFTLDGSGQLTLNFGTGSTELNADDFPVIDTAGNFTGSTVEAVLAEIFNSSSASDLATTLGVGNTTSGNDIVMTVGDKISSSSGDSFLDLRFGGADNQIYFGNNATPFNKSYVAMLDTAVYLGFNQNQILMDDSVGIQVSTDVFYSLSSTATDPWLAINYNGMSIGDPTGISSVSAPIFIADVGTSSKSANTGSNEMLLLNSGEDGANESTFQAGVTNSVAVGGNNLNVKTDYTAYVNQISFQEAGNTFDVIVEPPTATADRTQTLQDADGIIALVEDTPVTLIEFLADEFVEIRNGQVPYMVPSTLAGKTLKSFSAKVITKNDNVTFELNKNGTTIASSSTTITTAGLTNSATLSETLAEGDIIRVETTAIGTTFSQGLILNLYIG